MALAPVNSIATAVFERTSRVYGRRAERYVLMEVGHVGQNIHLQAEAMGLGTVAVAAFWRKMAAQRVTMQVKYDLAVRQVVEGEKALVVFPGFVPTVTAIRAGAPLQIVHLKEGTTYFLNGVVVVKNAPHPNAAMVFLNWLFSRLQGTRTAQQPGCRRVQESR